MNIEILDKVGYNFRNKSEKANEKMDTNIDNIDVIFEERQGELNSLKEALAQELQKTSTNYDKILHLSHKIASLDDEHARFSVDSGLITRLGQELVARQETAVSELVKNAYDADATEVSLTFIDSDQVGGTLEIVDNGLGMSRDELINGFMRISSSNKIDNPFSQLFNRKRAGQKGIGRFAVQRLGQTLTIITKTAKNIPAIKLSINWNDYSQQQELLQVAHKLSIDNEEQHIGTKLIIGELRDKWTVASIKRIFRYVSDIMSPNISLAFPVSFENNTPEIDPGFSEEVFNISFKKITNNDTTNIAQDRIRIEDFALATISAHVDEYGKGHYRIFSEKLGIDFSGDVSEEFNESNSILPYNFSSLCKIRFFAFYFILSDAPKNMLKVIQAETKRRGGVRLYRNGFRVLPYGEQGDDWLKLDKSVRDRVLLPPHGNNNILGFVEIKDDQNLFCETSSREGLLENESFIQLKNFLYKVIITAILKINRARGIKLTSGQKKDDNGDWEPLEIKIKSIAHLADELDEQMDIDSPIEAKEKRRKKIKAIKGAIKALESAEKENRNKYLQERNRLRILASIGLSVAQFSHEIKNCVDYINNDLFYIKQNADNKEKVLATQSTLAENFSGLYSYTSFFDEAVSNSLINELTPIDLYERTNRFRDSHLNTASVYGIEILPIDVQKYRLFTKPMHPSEWASILFNLFSNSVKAIKRTNRPGKILISCGECDRFVFIEFSDSGDGISEENAPHIFDEFFTTTAPKSYEDVGTDDIQGTGLGLKIVKDIIDSYRGNIMLIPPPGDFATCFRVEIPKANEKDYEIYDL